MLSTEQTQRSLWLGDLPPWVDEGFLLGIFAGTNQLVSVKLIRNRSTGASEGYAFLEFRTHEAADTILKNFNGHPMPNTDLVFRLNWAAYGVGKAQPAGEGRFYFPITPILPHTFSLLDSCLTYPRPCLQIFHYLLETLLQMLQT